MMDGKQFKELQVFLRLLLQVFYYTKLKIFHGLTTSLVISDRRRPSIGYIRPIMYCCHSALLIYLLFYHTCFPFLFLSFSMALWLILCSFLNVDFLYTVSMYLTRC